ncbi:ribokinase [Devosia nitrariae]|uniref:Ribokinase n=1 Tax=Devosia nitrariae TaxID=2071872 RepID=A0ABQ5W2K5_9HYPH|nr:ribokinase [Devosia nitrariae]
MASTDRPVRVVCVGAATYDLLFRLETLPDGPGKVLPFALLEVAHGMAASAAAAAARLGAQASLVARVGDDDIGTRIIGDLTAAGVDCRWVRQVQGARSPTSAVLIDRRGERLVVPYYDPALGTDTDWLSLDKIAEADAVLVDVRWPQGAARILDTAREAGIPGVLDADVGPDEVVVDLVSRASHAVFSEPAAARLSGTRDPAAAVAEIARRFPAFIAVTAGPQGCFWDDGGTVRQQRPPAVEAVDTLAAGDVFHGAFVTALAEGMPMREVIDFANTAAALKCEVFGGRLGAPDRARVVARMTGER